MYCSSKPYYSDPDAREAQSLLLASYALAEAGRLREAEKYAAEAATLLQGAPYDKKARCRILGTASYYPSGTIRVAHPGLRDPFDVPSDPYAVDEEKDAAAVLAARKKDLRDGAMRTAKDLQLGWPASAQLSAALSGNRPRPSGKTLAKALAAIKSAADAAHGCGWSDEAMAIFRAAMLKCGLLPYGELGSRDARADTEHQAIRKNVSPDEGDAGETGGWVLWLPKDVLEDLAARVLSLERADWSSLSDAIRPALPMRRGAWFPGSNYPAACSEARRIGRDAVDKALRDIGVPCQLSSSYLSECAGQEAENAVRTALHARAMFDAARVFRAAADRDAYTERVFKDAGMIPDGPVPEPGDASWYAGIASASVDIEDTGYCSGWIKGNGITQADQARFAALVTENIRTDVRAWFQTDKVASLLVPLAGAYFNCPVPAGPCGDGTGQP